ncbi:Cyclin-dependent kinase inhibitor 5 [Nymphaea thermarum]|nr:Cyclin-dependent kinase inhibitor 5 [Nymphaea thermarum]
MGFMRAAAGLQKTASYLQLRSRRLVKPPFLSSPQQPHAEQPKPHSSDHPKRAQQQERASSRTNSAGCGASNKSNAKLAGAANSARSRSVSVSPGRSKPKPSENEATTAAVSATSSGTEHASESETAVEASFGENVIEGEARESSRSVRETTPCSLMRNSESLEAPGSTTKTTNQSESNRRIRNGPRRSIPTAREMEEFFSDAEQQEKQRFIEKYNYDPVNDLPLPGRYEWIRLIP